MWIAEYSRKITWGERMKSTAKHWIRSSVIYQQQKCIKIHVILLLLILRPKEKAKWKKNDRVKLRKKVSASVAKKWPITFFIKGFCSPSDPDQPLSSLLSLSLLSFFSFLRVYCFTFSLSLSIFFWSYVLFSSPCHSFLISLIRIT